MSKTQATWLMGAVMLGLVTLVVLAWKHWDDPARSVLNDKSKYLLSRSCTDAEGWPEVTDYSVSCHAFNKELHIHLKERE